MNSKEQCDVRRAACGTALRRYALRTSHFALVVGLLGGASGCTPLDEALGLIPWFNTMRESPSYDPYQVPRLPAAGTVPVVNPRGAVPPPFTQAELNDVAATLQNPLEPTPEVLARGEQLYQQHCYTCHGPQGAGDGPVVGPGKFPYALPVYNTAIAQYSDGYLYGIIRVGRGFMPAYGARMPHLDRWAVVNYMRQLDPPPGGAAPTAVPPPGAAGDTAAAPPQ